MASRKRSAKQKRSDAYIVQANKIQLDTVIDPRLFQRLETVLSQALQSSGNDPRLRETMNAFSLEVKMQSMSRFGYITTDSEVLSTFLRKTDPNHKEGVRKPEGDIFEYLQKVLESDCYGAALTMREVWDCFGRFLQVASRGFERGGGAKRSTVMQPLDVMPDEVWEIYKDNFKPWISAASRRRTPRLGTGNVINAEIVHRVIVMEQFPAQIDGYLGLARGQALKTLKIELALLYAPVERPLEEDTIRSLTMPEEPAVAA